MPANPCRDFFVQHAGNPNFVKELQENPDQSLAWEDLTASDSSPGPVENGELLYRQVITHPLHVDPETKQLKPTAFDDASSKGLSVDRVSYKPLTEIHESGKQRAAELASAGQSPERKYLGVVALNSQEVRQILTVNGARAFAIYDTGLSTNVAHADICQVVSGKQFGRSARSQLVDAASPLIDG